MRKPLIFPITRSVDSSGLENFKINIGPTVSAEICVELTLLERQFVNNMRLSDPIANVFIDLQLDSEIEPNQVARILLRNAGSISIGVSPTEIQLLVDFFLDAYLNEVAPVNHVHLEVSGAPTSGSLEITFMGMNALPPISPEEATRIMENGA